MKFNKRGVSPVIAVLLLIVIAVAAAVLTYLWVLGYIGTMQTTGGTEQLQEKIKIESVDLSGSSIYRVYVRNIGDTQVVISAIYVIFPSGDAAQIYSGSTTINPGSVVAITRTSTVTLTSGYTYVVKAVTTSGVEATYVFTYKA